MGNFRRDDRHGDRRSFGRRSFNNDRGGDRQMHKATCSNCGKECEVPFRPTGAKPVYCSDCFKTMGGGDSRQSDNRRPNFGNRDNRSSREPSQNNAKLDELNAKLDKILGLLSTNSSPVKVKTPVVPKPEAVEVEAPQEPKLSETPKLPEFPEVPQEEKIVENIQLQPEEPTIVPGKKGKAPKKATNLPIPE